MKKLLNLFLVFAVPIAAVAGNVSVMSVTAQQRYPWNGLVDIVVTMQGAAEDVAKSDCLFAATNSATKATILVEHITQNGVDEGSGNVWTRKFVWDAKSDVGTVKIDDVALTVDAKILGGVQLWENGPYWAECNVGASRPEEAGYYFWWGDTAGYKRNANNDGWISVKDSTSFSFSDGNCPTCGKSNFQLLSGGYIDVAGNLVSGYDAATAHLGAPWRMPTDAEFSALINNCRTTWTTRNGVAGRLVTGKGAYLSKSIFLPAAGYSYESDLYSLGSSGVYWSSTPYSVDYDCAWGLRFTSSSSNFRRENSCGRLYGRSVRPVRGFAGESGCVVFSDNAVTTHFVWDPPVLVSGVEARPRHPWNGLVDITVTLQGAAEDVVEAECVFSASNCATKMAIPVANITRNGDDADSDGVVTRKFIWNSRADVGAVKIDDVALTVDLKPLGGVQLWEDGPYWAECNVGASQPEECGYYFWWGDTVGYKRNSGNNGWVSVKDGSSFSFGFGNCLTKDKDNSQLLSVGYIDSMGNLVATHDAATVHLGAPWRMPTAAEFSALINNCTTTWTTRNGVYGRLVTGNGDYASKSIFLPAAGDDNPLGSLGSLGLYWSSTPFSDNSGCAWYLYFYSGNFYRSYGGRHFGQSIRPVRGFANVADATTGVALSGVMTTHLALDCRDGVRGVSADGEELRYDASWYANGSQARITDNGMNIVSGVVGTELWMPTSCGDHHLLLTVVNDIGAQVGSASADFIYEHARKTTITAIEPTCTTAGRTAEVVCTRCGETLETSHELAALGHDRRTTITAVEPTCTMAGRTAEMKCTRCGETLETSHELAALGHSEVITKPAIEPTSSKPGMTAEIKCSRCGLLIQAATEIPAIEPQPTNDVSVLYVDGVNGNDSNSGKSASMAKKTIQAAIDVATTGDEICVRPGIYAPITALDKALVIVAEQGPACTIIDGGGSSVCAILGVSYDNLAQWSTLRGFTIQHGYYGDAGAAARWAYLDGCVIKECRGWAIVYACKSYNCLAYGNTCTSYGVFMHGDAYNCTVVDGGGRYAAWDNGFYNCIVLAGIYLSYGQPECCHNCLLSTSRSKEEGNIVGDPKFVDADNGDYRLAVNSPCIDAGSDSYVMSETDLDGNARIANGRVDIGAYEYGSVPLDQSSLPVKGAEFHVDASDLSTMTCVTENGKTYVTRWNDASGGSRYATAGTRKPYLGTFNGRTVVDFGCASYNPPVGDCAWMAWSEREESIREVFIVCSDHIDYPNTEYGPRAFLLTSDYSSNRYDFHRDMVGEKDAPGLFRANYASSYIRNGLIQVDGQTVAYDYALPEGFHIIRVRTTGNVAANTFAKDRDCRYGGQRLAEAIIYDKMLTDDEAKKVYEYLRAKWFSTPEDPEVQTYTITFNANGGTPTPSSITRKKGESYGGLPTVTRSGYVFDGWYTAASGGTRVSAETIVTADVTLYAHWSTLPGYSSQWFPGGLLDICSGTRWTSETQKLTMSPAWEDDGVKAIVSVDGVPYQEAASAGECTWAGTRTKEYTLTHQVVDADGVAIGEPYVVQIIWLAGDLPAIRGDENSVITGDAESGFIITPNVDSVKNVEVIVPRGMDVGKVLVKVPAGATTVKPNGTRVKIVSGGADITEFLNVPAAGEGGVIDLSKATVKEEIVKEVLDPVKDAKIELNAANPKLTTAPTRVGLFYLLREGETLGGMRDGDSTIGNGQPWMPKITIKNGNSAFYSIGVGKGN